MMKRSLMLLGCSLLFSLSSARAEITVHDDHGNTIVLKAPAKRVVSLAPHTTELLFAAGAGEHIVGTVTYSDYPAAAKSIPRVGDHHLIDIERLISMKPDLLVVWLHGSSARQLDALKRLGIPVFYSEPRKLADIPNTLEQLGKATGTEQFAQQSGRQLRDGLAQLEKTYGNRPRVRVFYQVWHRPLYTLGGVHIVSDAIRVCGGENIFQSLKVSAPTVSIESVLLENPEVIVHAYRPDKPDKSLEPWRAYPTITAVERNNLFDIDADLINRAGPRMIEGAASLCAHMEEARHRRENGR